MTDAQIIALAAIAFALLMMWSVARHQRRVRDRCAQRQDAQRLGRRQEPGPTGHAQGVLPDPHAGERDE